MSNCAIVGINWGDEGKGRMVDLVTEQYDVVVRYQGGNNAGHTVINEYGKFALHLIPSGIFRKGVVNVLGNGVVIDCEHLWKEISDLRAAGIDITPDNFRISDRATLVFPFHRDLDALEESRLKDRPTAPPIGASRRFTATNTRKRPSRPASCSIPSISAAVLPVFWSGRISPLKTSITPNPIPSTR